MSDAPWAIVGLAILGMLFQVLYHFKHKEVQKLEKKLNEPTQQENNLKFELITQRVIREMEFDDNFCRKCKSVVRPAGHFCYSCGMAYPLKKEKA